MHHLGYSSLYNITFVRPSVCPSVTEGQRKRFHLESKDAAALASER